MRIFVDALVTRDQPDLFALLPGTGFDPVVAVFDPFLSPAALGAEMSTFLPDIILVDPAWLVISPLLMAVVHQSGCAGARCVIGSRQVDNVLKIRAAHGGFFDVIDLTRSPDDMAKQLEGNHRGVSQLDSDSLWRSVQRPAVLSDVVTAATDSTDLAILELVRIGLTDAAIAESIHMSQQTVRNRVSAMLRKSGLTNRTQMAWAFTIQALAMLMMQNMNAGR